MLDRDSFPMIVARRLDLATVGETVHQSARCLCAQGHPSAVRKRRLCSDTSKELLPWDTCRRWGIKVARFVVKCVELGPTSHQDSLSRTVAFEYDLSDIHRFQLTTLTAGGGRLPRQTVVRGEGLEPGLLHTK